MQTQRRLAAKFRLDKSPMFRRRGIIMYNNACKCVVYGVIKIKKKKRRIRRFWCITAEFKQATQLPRYSNAQRASFWTGLCLCVSVSAEAFAVDVIYLYWLYWGSQLRRSIADFLLSDLYHSMPASKGLLAYWVGMVECLLNLKKVKVLSRSGYLWMIQLKNHINWRILFCLALRLKNVWLERKAVNLRMTGSIALSECVFLNTAAIIKKVSNILSLNTICWCWNH